MNRRGILIIAALIFAMLSMALGIKFVSAQAPNEAEAPAQPEVALGQPGLSYRYVGTFGVTGEAYLASTQYINEPEGIFIDGSGNVFVTEQRGCRVLKYNSAGSNVLALGKAGYCRNGDYAFTFPADAAQDGAGNIWVVDTSRVVQYSSSGTFLQNLPTDEPWAMGNDNTRFEWPSGVVFDSQGRMYISDSGNQRIQVFSFSGSTPVYSATIGVTDVAGSGNTHFNWPAHIVMDSSDRLYVVDTNNNRVQRCTYSGGSWGCETFASGLSSPYGITRDSLNNIYITDNGNSRLLKCSPVGSCSTLISGLPSWAADVAVDASGNIYLPLNDGPQGQVVRKYNSSGGLIGTFAGVQNVPYVVDANRYNTPWGIAVASDGSLYVAERFGFRLVKMNASGVQQWAKGQAGVYGLDNNHFGAYWGGPEGDLAIDSSGRVYVPDTGNHRIQVFNANGSHYLTFGSYGTGNNQFDCPAGVAISPVNGDIYVADKCNQRVQVYGSNWIYKGTFGVTRVKGSDNAHFNDPWGIAVDNAGNALVADAGNHRVQQCTLSPKACTTFLGETEVPGDDFGHLSHPLGVTVDNHDRIYVADEGNNRVQVFDSGGAYLTTIGGAWGTNTGQMIAPSGIAVDGSENVYVTDRENQRIQKFSPGVPGWRQVNINGFGERNNNDIARLSVHGDYLYAGTDNRITGAEIWRTADGKNWLKVSQGGFGNVNNVRFHVESSINGFLYVGTENHDTGAELWRCAVCDGSDWQKVVTGGLTSSSYDDVQRVLLHAGKLYATVDGQNGLAVWRSSTGAYGTWTQVNTIGFGNSINTGSWPAAVFKGHLYVGTAQWTAMDQGTSTGIEVWRCVTCDGTDWVKVNLNGFGDPKSIGWWMESYQDNLYVSIVNYDTGTQIWRCSTCDGNDWSKVISDGFGGARNLGAMFVTYKGRFYALTMFNWRISNAEGGEVWVTDDGIHWKIVMTGGWGDSNNGKLTAMAILGDRLFIGSANFANGGEIWQLLKPVYLPFIKK